MTPHGEDERAEGRAARDLKTEKRRVRDEVLARRDRTDRSDRERAAEAVGDAVRGLLRDHGAGTVLAFWAFGSELPTSALIEGLVADGHIVCLPRIVGRRLEARTWRPGEASIETSFGAREPAGGRVVLPAELDALLVPAVAFDGLGYRVGYGGGFYDRLLPQVRADALRIGIGLGVQRVERVPRGSFDVPVDLIVTEAGIEDAAGRRRST